MPQKTFLGIFKVIFFQTLTVLSRERPADPGREEVRAGGERTENGDGVADLGKKSS